MKHSKLILNALNSLTANVAQISGLNKARSWIRKKQYGQAAAQIGVNQTDLNALLYSFNE